MRVTDTSNKSIILSDLAPGYWNSGSACQFTGLLHVLQIVQADWMGKVASSAWRSTQHVRRASLSAEIGFAVTHETSLELWTPGIAKEVDLDRT
ncbi:hypothetical protein J6590_080844 [Homalodisca vitripennis]|nr:hypothetical protein J6590_080844 [Homalodisca vitripennis]